MNRAVIEEYIRGGSVLPAALKGLSKENMLAFPIPDTWSIQQIVLHIMDSDLIASDRMKRIIAEENPTIIGFDETAFSKRLFYEELDAGLAADIFQKNRMLTGEILRRLPDAAFERVGTHNERGKLSLKSMVELYVQHLEHHLKFLRHKRQLLGKPL